MRGPCLPGIAVEQRAAVVGGKEPLVRIDDEAIGQLDSGKGRSHARRGQSREAVGAVDVQPEVALAADRRHSREIVDHPQVRRPG